MRILVFGDSTAQGYYDLEHGGWANRLFLDNLKRKVRRPDNAIEIVNVSISGDTTRKVVDRLKAEIEARQWDKEPLALVVAIGINDTLLEDNEPISTPDTYRKDLGALYAIAQEYTREVVFVGLEAVDEAESAPWKYNSGTHQLAWRNERIHTFDEVLKVFASKHGAEYVAIFEAFMKRQEQGEKLCADGLHPNAAGHELMYRLIEPTIAGIISRLP